MSEAIPLFPGQREHGIAHGDAPKRTETHANAVPYRVRSDAELLALALWRVIKVV